MNRSDRPCSRPEPWPAALRRPASRRNESRRCRWAVPVAAMTLLIAAMPSDASAMTYDRAKAISYAAANYNKVVSDGYFWIDSGTCKYCGAGVAAPSGTGLASGVGDDCAHFVSSCIGAPSGAGIAVHQPFANSSSSSYRGQYGDPSAGGLASWLVSSGDAVFATSVSSLVGGDVIAYDWTGNGSIDHIVFYMGNGLISAHATSHLNVCLQLGSQQQPEREAHVRPHHRPQRGDAGADDGVRPGDDGDRARASATRRVNHGLGLPNRRRNRGLARELSARERHDELLKSPRLRTPHPKRAIRRSTIDDRECRRASRSQSRLRR